MARIKRKYSIMIDYDFDDAINLLDLYEKVIHDKTLAQHTGKKPSQITTNSWIDFRHQIFQYLIGRSVTNKKELEKLFRLT